MRRIFDTESLAAAFPVASGDLAAPAPGQRSSVEAVMYGVNTTSHGVVMWNRWVQDNHNSVVLARSGAGKSYLVKLDVLRSLYQGVEVAVIDPEDEYTPLAQHVGGTVIQLGVPGVRLNPLDLPADTRPDTLRRRQLTLHTIVAVMLGSVPPPSEKEALDRAITATYSAAGVSHDPTTWGGPAPLLRDLAVTLKADPDSAAQQMTSRLALWTQGSFSDLFAGPTTVRPAGQVMDLQKYAAVWVNGSSERPASAFTRRRSLVAQWKRWTPNTQLLRRAARYRCRR
jgi:hypothetical protein